MAEAGITGNMGVSTMKRELLIGHDALVADFVTKQSPLEKPDFGEHFHGLGILRDDGALIGGIVFSGYRAHFSTVEMSAAFVSYYGLSPQIIGAIGAYVFGQLQLNRVWSRTAVKNRRACKLLEHIGFRPEGDLADYYGVGVPARTYRMLKREWMARHRQREAA